MISSLLRWVRLLKPGDPEQGKGFQEMDGWIANHILTGPEDISLLLLLFLLYSTSFLKVTHQFAHLKSLNIFVWGYNIMAAQQPCS